MSLILRGGVYHCQFTASNGQRIRRSLKTANKKQAQELLDQLKAESWRVSEMGDLQTRTFEEACLRWGEEKGDKRSFDDDRVKMAFFLQHFKGRDISTITAEEVQRIVSKMIDRNHLRKWEQQRDAALRKGKEVSPYKEKAIAAGTRAHYLSWIRSLLRAAANDWGWIESAPNIKTKKPNEKRIRWLSKQDAARLVDCMPESIKPVVIFALATGLRRSNIVDLEWSQVDLERKIAWINPENAKAGKAIGVALNETARKVLREQIGKSQQWVFVHTKPKARNDGTIAPAGRKMRSDDNAAWRSGLKKAGIENFRFHDLRHTWASWLVQAGVSLTALQEMGGWESIEMVQRYAHLSPGHLAEQASKIDGYFGDFDTKLTQGGKQGGLRVA